MIINAAKRVGITKTGLNVKWMQVDKFIQAEECTQTEEDTEDNMFLQEDTPSTSLINSPVAMRRGSNSYYKQTYLDALKVIDDMRKEKITSRDTKSVSDIKN